MILSVVVRLLNTMITALRPRRLTIVALRKLSLIVPWIKERSGKRSNVHANWHSARGVAGSARPSHGTHIEVVWSPLH